MSDGDLQVLWDHSAGHGLVEGINVQRIDPMLIGASGVATAFGTSVPTVRRWLRQGLIPAPRRVGHRLLWSTDELRDWISAGCLPCPPGEADVALGQSEAAR